MVCRLAAGVEVIRHSPLRKDTVKIPPVTRRSQCPHLHSLSRTSSVQNIQGNRTVDGPTAMAPRQIELLCQWREGHSTDCILSHCWTIFNRPLDYQRCPRMPCRRRLHLQCDASKYAYDNTYISMPLYGDGHARA